MINSENAMLRGSVLFNVRDRDLGSTVKEAQEKLNEMMTKMPKGYYVEWSGQWENQIRANKTLSLILPIVVVIIFLILYFTYHSMKEALITMITVPFALIGGVFMVYFYGINLSVAVAVGFIALFGLAIETAMLITIYLNEAMNKMVEKHGNSKEALTEEIVREYIIEGSGQAIAPKIDDGFGFIIWFDSDSLGNGNGCRCNASNHCSAHWRNNYFNDLCIIGNPCCF